MTVDQRQVIGRAGRLLSAPARAGDFSVLREALEHARQLVIALGALSGKAPRGLVVGALRPVLEPLMRAVLDEADDEVSE